MFLKLMTRAGETLRLVEVYDCQRARSTGAAITFRPKVTQGPLNTLAPSETVIIEATAFLMNGDGRTIEKFPVT